MSRFFGGLQIYKYRSMVSIEQFWLDDTRLSLLVALLHRERAHETESLGSVLRVSSALYLHFKTSEIINRSKLLFH